MRATLQRPLSGVAIVSWAALKGFEGRMRPASLTPLSRDVLHGEVVISMYESIPHLQRFYD